MGCYGLGISRLMGVIVERFHDDKGIIWPESVAPFQVHLLDLPGGDSKKVYESLLKDDIEVLYDDRDASAGEKFADSDLIGIPWRAVASKKTGDKIELKKRGEEKVKLVSIKELLETLKS